MFRLNTNAKQILSIQVHILRRWHIFGPLTLIQAAERFKSHVRATLTCDLVTRTTSSFVLLEVHGSYNLPITHFRKWHGEEGDFFFGKKSNSLLHKR